MIFDIGKNTSFGFGKIIVIPHSKVNNANNIVRTSIENLIFSIIPQNQVNDFNTKTRGLIWQKKNS